MKTFFAIGKLTFLYYVRKRVLHLLLLLIVGSAFLLPMILVGDGSAHGQLQLSLHYTIGFIGVVSSFITLWISCVVMAEDIESWRIHLLVIKPVPASIIWLGKWSVIILVQGTTLLLASCVAYHVTLGKINADYPKETFQKLQREVLTARKLYLPEPRKAPITNSQNLIPSKKPQEKKEFPLISIRENSQENWFFTGIGNVPKEEAIFLRYRMYVEKMSIRSQKETTGIWWIYFPKKQRYYPLLQKVMSGSFQELLLPASVIDDSGTLKIRYENRDTEKKTVVFQKQDGPYILIKASSFWQNFIRVLLLMIFQLVFVAALGCSAGAIFSLPMAIFLSCSYLFIGMIIPNAETAFIGENLSPLLYLLSQIAFLIRYSATLCTIPIQQFSGIHFLVEGELISGKFLLLAARELIAFRGIPVAAIGMWYFSWRELGLVAKK